MTRRDVLILAAIVVAFTVCALAIPWAKAADSFGMPGDLTVGDDLTVSGDAVVDLKLSVGDTASFLFYNCADILQQYVIQWDESAQTGKAYPDTFLGNMTARVLYAPRVPGRIAYVDLFVDTAGAGWDSLKVDILGGADGDTTVFTEDWTQPMLIPGDGDKALSWIDGRSGTLDATHRVIDAGEIIYIDAELYGDNKASPPSGVIVWLYYQPDYQQD